MEEKEEILTAVNESFRKLDQKMTDGFTKVHQRFNEVDQRFKKLEEDVDKLHTSQIKLEGMRSDLGVVAENVMALSNRFTKWDGEEDDESIPVRVSRLEMRVTRLEKKKGRN